MATGKKPLVGGSGVVADTKEELPKEEFPKEEFPKEEFPKEEFPKEEVEALREKPNGETLG